ncbi:palmitoyltransferase ZDHHC16-like [Oscarella lobularis]|uniref:palmitoyltransferase ZDHHC16-like n=1 Tax=Oscarella lobularis TaxID=121494 RepID=UPI00331448C7
MTALSGRPLRYMRIFRQTVCSLTYTTERKTPSYVADAILSALILVFYKLVSLSGPLFVVGVVLLISLVVVTVYLYILPVYVETSYFLTTIYIILGHWLLANIAFHYYMCVATRPGSPPAATEFNLRRGWKFCHKCMQMKPPRTHHCTACKRCVLKMDHHCPWINNCVGHLNHRYFLLFCVYISIGAAFVAWISWNTFSEMFFATEISLDDYTWRRSLVIPVTVLCLTVCLAVGMLASWHSFLISTGQTSIELHVNRELEKTYLKHGFIFLNRNDYGVARNWRLFLGLTGSRNWRSLLWPSAHKPPGSGLEWDLREYLDNGTDTSPRSVPLLL